jgi:hypothetical protein|tara:strand:+ start:16 stop:912 length:897 start_codon:yes stop_codon:yes gene_type:complete
MAKIRPRKKLQALAINEEVGDIPTHYFKSGSSMRPKEQLQDLNEFKTYLLPEEARGTTFEYDVWFNTNENVTIRKWLYTDFLGKGIYVRVNSRPINTKLFKSIVNSDIKIDEERIEKIRNNLENKYSLQWNTEFYDKVVFLPGSNLLCKGTVINHGRVKALVDQGWKVKPHPITAHIYMADLKRRYGAENVLNKKEGGFELLLNCKEMACSQNSEMGLIALLLGKNIQMVSYPVEKREKNLLTYESFYESIAETNAKETILKLFSSKRSGIIFNFDTDAKDRLENYLNNFWEYKIIND